VAATEPFPHAGDVAALSSSVLWASAGIVFRRMKGRAQAGAINLAKNTTGAVCFLVVLLVATGTPWPQGLSTPATLLLVASGLVGLSVCDTFFLRAILEVGPRAATLVMAGLAPALVFLVTLGPPFDQAPLAARPWPWVGFALAVTGVVLAVREIPDGPHDRVARRRGFRDAVVAAVFQAAGVLLSRLAIQEGAPPVEGACLRLVSGSLGLVVGGLALGHAGSWAKSLSARGVLPRLATAAFFGTFLGIGLNQAGLAWSPSTGVATTLNALSPVWLIPLSAVFLGERHGAVAWSSTALAIGGAALLALAV
jgi:drug/metabolite transporter (DMT)-like permease